MTIEIRIANNDDEKEWNTIISQSFHGTIFHQWNWLKITEKHSEMKLYPLIVMRGNNPLGIIPLFFQKIGPVRMVFSPPPRAALFYLGPVLIGYDKLKQEKRENNYIEFQKHVENFIKYDLKANYINISLSPDLQDPRPFGWAGYTIKMDYDYITDLTIGLDCLLQSLDKRRRQNLNRARKRGISIEMGGKEEFEVILDLMDIRYAQQTLFNMESRRYLLDIYDAYKENIKIFIAKIDDEIISGNIDFQNKDKHYSWIGNPKPKIPLSPSPNDLLIWESIRYAHERGCNYYITMSAAGNKRLHSYYAAKFNPKLNIRFSAKKNSFFTGLLEEGYVSMYKPIKGKIRQLMKK
jgi:hypothetical protein